MFFDKKRVYIVLALADAGTLKDHLGPNALATELERACWFAQIVRALLVLRLRNLTHRDLKPENIVLARGPNGELGAKLTDFGLAVYLRKGELGHTFCGTPLYIPPEVYLLRSYDQTRDVWSLGVLLFEMLAGEPPFHMRSETMMHGEVIFPPIHKPTKFRHSTRQLVKKMLDLEPSARPTLEEIQRLTAEWIEEISST